MKTFTLKITGFLLLTMFAVQLQAQIVTGETYRLKNVKSGQYLRCDGSSTPSMADFVAGDTGFNWAMIASGSGTLVNINSELEDSNRNSLRGTGGGTIVVTTKASPNTDTDKRWEIIFDAETGYNRFLLDNNTRYLVDEAGTPVNQNATTIGDDIDSSNWIAEPITGLSTEKFDASSIFISNPVNNVLNIKGITENIKQVSIFSLIGKNVLTVNVEAQSDISLDISALTSGIYLVKMQSDKGDYTKKIVKQ